jgi:hypothetical protein
MRKFSVFSVSIALILTTQLSSADTPCENLNKTACSIFLTGLSTAMLPTTLVAATAGLSKKLSAGKAGENKLMEVVAPEAAEFLMLNGQQEPSSLLRTALDTVKGAATDPALVSDMAAAELLLAAIEELR